MDDNTSSADAVTRRLPFKEGDASKAFCSACECVVPTTFRIRDVPFSDGLGSARVLAGTCNTCGSVCAIPAQSMPAIRRARRDTLTGENLRSVLARDRHHEDHVLHALGNGSCSPSA